METEAFKDAYSENCILRTIPDDPPIYFESSTEYNRVTDVQNSNTSLLPEESSGLIENYPSHDEITNRYGS